MAEIIYRLPSKVPYGYVEVRYSAEDVATIFDTLEPEEIADDYIRIFKRFKDAEEKALTFKPPILKAKPEPTVEEVLSEDEVKDLLVKELGAVPVDETGDEPWNNKPEQTEKKWEAPSDDAWDFG
jgi:hypothetical protein